MDKVMDSSLKLCMFVCTVSLILYLPRIIAWFGAFKPQQRIKATARRKIAVVIPARNESKTIDRILGSLKEQTYPKEFFDIHVIVADCHDETIARTLVAGGEVFVAARQKCKGDAIEFYMNRMMIQFPDKYDAFYIADADCILAPDCLEEMNNAMEKGTDIVQSKKKVKNYLYRGQTANSLASECNGFIWTLIDDMGNRFKSDHGITNMTIGTGILLRNDFVKRIGGWPYRKTLTEDMELMYDSAVNGYTSFYYSYSVIYVEESVSLHVTNVRRTRWMTGLIDSEAIYHEKLTKERKKMENFWNIYYVKALWPVFVYIGTLSFFCMSNLALFVCLTLTGRYGSGRALMFSVSSFLTIYLSFFLMTLCCLIVERKNMPVSIGRKFLLLIIHPFFYMGYISIVTRAFLKKNDESWQAIERVDFGS